MEQREFINKLTAMQTELANLAETLAIVEKQQAIALLEQEIASDGFWHDQKKAQTKINEQNELKEIVDVWQELTETLNDTALLYEMIQEDFSEQAYQELISDFQGIIKQYDAFMLQILFSGTHDHANAYLEIHPGEGGVDAQDFAQILYRMYIRWCEKEQLKYQVLEYQNGDEAGIKSALIYIKGQNAYGKLKSESGVHRLVRLSPFDTAKRRHTSFASISVLPEIDQSIDLIIEDGDLKIDTFRASGAGGQSVNTTDSAVRITHLPTGTVVTCQNERSQIQNKEQAMKILYAKLYELEEQKKQQEQNILIGERGAIGFGHQIRSYVFHPYNMVKDHRTNYEVGNVGDVIDGNINGFIESYLKYMTKT